MALVVPEFDWLAANRDADESWLGPGPMLVNLQPWMEQLAVAGPRVLVGAMYAAAQAACRHWDAWLARSPDDARDSILEGRPPTEQLAAVAGWLTSPTETNRTRALDTVDLTKQLHWFHEEYCDRWFDEPGIWAVESSEQCVLSLTGDPYSQQSRTSLATVAVSCAVNSFRNSAKADIRDPLKIVIDSIRRQFAELE